MSKGIYLVKLNTISLAKKNHVLGSLRINMSDVSEDVATRLYQASSVKLRNKQLKKVGDRVRQGLDITQLMNYELTTPTTNPQSDGSARVTGAAQAPNANLEIKVSYSGVKDMVLLYHLVPQVPIIDTISKLYVDINGIKRVFLTSDAKLQLDQVKMLDTSKVTKAAIKQGLIDKTKFYTINDRLVDDIYGYVTTKLTNLESEMKERLRKVFRDSNSIFPGYQIVQSAPVITEQSTIEDRVVKAV